MPAPADEIHIWRAPLSGGGPPADGLPAGERGRAARMAGGPVRERWVAARWALRTVLARYTGGDAAAIELAASERGKPRLADPGASLRFNLSHSGDLALIAVAGELEVGIDVERIEPRRELPALARRALPAEEAERIAALPPDERLDAFHAAWTRREAVAKCFGTGLAAPLPDAPVAVADLDLEEPGYAAAVAAAAARMPALRRLALARDG